MSTKEKRTRPRGPTRTELISQIEEHEGILAEKDGELETMKQQMNTLAQVPPVLFTISVNRVTGQITSVPALSEDSSVKDLSLLLKALNIYQSNVVDLMADMVIKRDEEGNSEPSEEERETPLETEEGVSEESEVVEESAE